MQKANKTKISFWRVIVCKKISFDLTGLKVNNEMEIVVIVAKNCGVTISPDDINFAGT